jgi:hypothetical protein
MKSQYVQYGCGLSSPDSWINFDASPNLWLERLPVLGRFYSGTKNLEGRIVRSRFPENIRYGDISCYAARSNNPNIVISCSAGILPARIIQIKCTTA